MVIFYSYVSLPEGNGITWDNYESLLPFTAIVTISYQQILGEDGMILLGDFPFRTCAKLVAVVHEVRTVDHLLHLHEGSLGKMLSAFQVPSGTSNMAGWKIHEHPIIFLYCGVFFVGLITGSSSNRFCVTTWRWYWSVFQEVLKSLLGLSLDT